MSRIIGVFLLCCGFFLLLLSSPSLFLHIREHLLSYSFETRYELLPVPTKEPGMFAYANETDFHGNRIAFSDSIIGKDEEWKNGNVRITINGFDYSHSAEAVIRPNYRDSNRYHGYLALVELVDKKKKTSLMAVIQRIDSVESPPIMEKLQWRLLLVSMDGTVTEEIFSYKDRGSPLYRARLANFATPIAVGFQSDVLNFWPTIFYPFLFPYISGFLGFLFLFMGFVISRRAKLRYNRKHPLH